MTHERRCTNLFVEFLPPRLRIIIFKNERLKPFTSWKIIHYIRRPGEPADVPRETARGLCTVDVSSVLETIHLKNVYICYFLLRVSFDDLARYDDTRDYFVVTHAQRTLLQSNDIDEPWGRVKRREPVSFAARPSIADRY